MSVTRHPLCTSDTAKHSEGVPPDEALIVRLEASFRVATRNETALAERFYAALFKRAPELRSMFADDMTAQKKKLLDGLRMIIDNLRSPETVRLRLQELGAAHVRYGAKPAHYPVVCEELVSAIALEAGSEWTSPLQHEWTDAIRLVAEIMMTGARVFAVETAKDVSS